MAIRVEDIVVSEKNVYVLSGGRQFVADVEKKSNLTTSETAVSRNPWNLYTEDGSILCNLFDSEKFDIRSQITTGSSGSSKNGSDRHERMFMPNCGRYVGQCQLYGNAYSVSERTTATFDADYRVDVTGNTKTYSADYGFCRYLPVSAYEDGHFNYISPTDTFTPTGGINYLYEYPVNGFYSDFGNDYVSGVPTMYADAIATKYYLDPSFSVNGVAVGENGLRVRRMRDYLGIGNTGNSVYLTFRNDHTGSFDSDGTSRTPQSAKREYSFTADNLLTFGCLDNIAVCPVDGSGFAYSTDVNSDFSFSSEIDLMSAVRCVQPKDNSFMLYLISKDDGGVKKADRLVYIPKNGTVKSCEEWAFENDEDIGDVKFVETDSSVVVASRNNGLLNVFSKSHYYAFGMTDEKICPFERPKFGYPDKDFVDIFNGCFDYSVFYNGKGVLGVKCRRGGTDDCMSFASKAFSTDERDYEIGEYFQLLVCDGGEDLFRKEFVDVGITETETVRSFTKSKIFEETSTATVSAGGKADFLTDCVSGSVLVKGEFFEATEVSAILKRGSDGFCCDTDFFSVSLTASPSGNYDIYAANTVSVTVGFAPNVVTTNEMIPQTVVSDILFDYSSTSAFDVSGGDYLFVQFGGKGLKKIHADELMDERGYSVLSDCGVANRVADDSEICTDVKFSAVSYDDSLRDSSIAMSRYIGSDFESRRVTVKPAIKATFRKVENGKTIGYEQSFSVFPTEGRDETVKESVYGDSTVKDIESRPISEFDFAMGQTIPNSMGVAVRSIDSGTSKHDAAISLVHWNDEDGVYSTNADYNSEDQSVGGLYLQHSGICTDVVVNGYSAANGSASAKSRDRLVSTVSEYPHPCFGSLVTAGTGLKIFDGPLSDSMTVGDIFEINGYVVVKNYETASVDATPLDRYDDAVAKCGKTHVGGAHPFLHGGYVVTNFFSDLNNESTVKGLYGVEQVVGRTTTIGGDAAVNNYCGLWHIKPSKPIEFYPKSEVGKVWKPFYAGKYVDFILHHGGRYYISLRSEKDVSETTVGYDIVETDDLFTEKNVKSLSGNLVVTGMRFFDNEAVVEYRKVVGGVLSDAVLKSFKYGKADSKFDVRGIPADGADSSDDGDVETTKRPLDVQKTQSSDGVSDYDNVEVLYSLNRFTPVNSHKSNLFSVKVEDLGLDESPFLSDSQKKSVRIWMRNKIMDIVDELKPAHTEIFDVFVD